MSQTLQTSRPRSSHGIAWCNVAFAEVDMADAIACLRSGCWGD